jgi:hypothetical protein
VSVNQPWPQPGGRPPTGVRIGPAQLNGQVYDIAVAADRLLVGTHYSIPFAEIRDVRVDDTSYTVRRTPTWAIVLAVVLAFILLLGLLFLLVKEDRRMQRATVTVFTATAVYPFVMHGRTTADAYRIWYPLLAAGPPR